MPVIAGIGATATYTLYAAAASTAIAAAGTGLSYYAQQQQADNASAIAQYNYAAQQQNAKINAQMAQQQANWQAQNAQVQYQVQQQNAQQLNDQARAQEAQGREQARRMREDNERQLAVQRARYGASGVQTAGSPLAVMSETAGLLELGVQDMMYESDNKAKALDRQAELTRFDSQFSLFDEGVAKYQEAAAQAGLAMDLNQAAIDRASGEATAQGYRMAATGSLLSGIGDTIQTGAGWYDRYRSWQPLSTNKRNAR